MAHAGVFVANKEPPPTAVRVGRIADVRRAPAGTTARQEARHTVSRAPRLGTTRHRAPTPAARVDTAGRKPAGGAGGADAVVGDSANILARMMDVLRNDV